MTQNVSVPEKTLEHWASLCVAYRYRSLAAQWWPVNGVDIDLQALPAQPGKAIQLEVAGVLRQDLNAHRRRDRGVPRCLVQFDISDPDKAEWGDPASSVPPSEVLGDERPQLIRVPRLVLGRRRKARHRDEEEELYPRHELVEMFRQSEQLLAELQGRRRNRSGRRCGNPGRRGAR
ncbi:MAG: hypothetical protein ABSB76_21635 [Streptosporangiaceae bacterium]